MLRGKVGEDAITVIRRRNSVICAVADGHGDPKCKYADIGSKLATSVACEVLRAVIDGSLNITAQYDYFTDRREEIAQSIIQGWNRAVFTDYLSKSNEVTASKDEMFEYIDTMFSSRGKSMSVEETRKYYFKRDSLADTLHQITKFYGTTLNAVVITEKFIFCIGIGDGDIIAVQGKQIDWLLPPSEQFSTRTQSLCYKPQVAFEAFRSIVIRKTKSKNRRITDTGINPDFVLLTTDGLRNSFVSDDHFAEKLLNICMEKKQEYIKFRRSSQKWIEQLTKDSLYQDDITFCFIY